MPALRTCPKCGARQPDPGRAPSGLSATLSVSGMPELIALLRRDLAAILMDAADDEPPELARKLRQYAALFETGLPSDDLDV